MEKNAVKLAVAESGTYEGLLYIKRSRLLTDVGYAIAKMPKGQNGQAHQKIDHTHLFLL
jgi:hypothetical protein